MSTPLKNGTPFFLWNIEKCTALLKTEHKPLSRLDLELAEVRRLRDAGDDKLGFMLLDDLFVGVPKDLVREVRRIIEAEERAADSPEEGHPPV